MASHNRKFQNGERVKFTPAGQRTYFRTSQIQEGIADSEYIVIDCDYGYKVIHTKYADEYECGNRYPTYETPWYFGNVQSSHLMHSDGTFATGSLEAFEKEMEKITAKIAELDKSRNELAARMVWMKANNVTVFDEMEYKIWAVIQKFNHMPLDDIERAKLIAELFKTSKK